MSLVISGSLVISDTQSGGGIVNVNNPLIGYQNFISTAAVSALTSADGFPASNVQNVSTYLRWQGVATSPEADEYLTINLDTNENIDYLGIARHNFFTGQIAVSVEGLSEPGSPENWHELISPFIPSSDGPLLFRFTSQALDSIRVRMQPGSVAPTVAVIYVGSLLVVQRRIFVGHTPIPFGRKLRVTNGRSEAGHFLGRIVKSEKRETEIRLENLTSSWFRENLEPFLSAAETLPFFFAWRPSDYPFEVGFCWLTNDAKPTNQHPNGFMEINMSVSGIV